MNSTNPYNYRWVQFSIRELLLLTLVVALICGWYSTQKQAQRARLLQEMRVLYAEREHERAKDQILDQTRAKLADPSRPFWLADFSGTNLQGIVIASSENIFQRASFRDAILTNASLKGDTASFQGASFDRANLAGATLRGGDASFQGASFIKADLTGATLIGSVHGSFGVATFEDAIMVKAKLSGNFQNANISGAHLEGADLSEINGDHLASCHFKNPPIYNANTKFPPGFDPYKQLWRRTN